jgi:gliding motility-associated-like protein
LCGDNGETGPTADSLLAGVPYIVTVTDSLGAMAFDTITIDSIPNTLSITAILITPACAGSANGSIIVEGAGGTPPYVFTWSNMMTGDTLLNLAPGDYIVTMTDNGNCTLVDTFTVNPIDSIAIDLMITPAACDEVDNGIAVANPDPAGGNYEYNWNINVPSTDSIVYGLAGGTLVQVTVIDQTTGCQGTASGVVPAGDGPEVAIDPTDATCVGDDNGSAIATGSGGTPGYSYEWMVGTDTVPGQEIMDLAPGVYTVTVTDANGCTDEDSTSIGVQSHPDAAFEFSAVCLPNNLVNITLTDQSTDTTSTIAMWEWVVTVGGDVFNFSGQGPINFPVNAGQNVQVILTITSDPGCVDDTLANFVAPMIPGLTLELDNSPNCGGIPDTITVTTDMGNTVTFDPATGITPGADPNTWLAAPDSQITYVVTASNGFCEIQESITITPAVSVEVNPQGGIVVDCDEVTLTATVKNGLSTVSWFDESGNGVGGTNPLIISLDSTSTYVVVASDAQGCTASDTITVMSEGVNVLASTTVLSGCEGDTLSMFVTNNNPNDVLTYAWSTNSSNLVIIGSTTSDTVFVSGTTGGTYTLTGVVTNQFNCDSVITVTVNIDNGQPAPAQAEVVGGGCSLSVQFSVAGGLTGTWDFGDGQTAAQSDTLYTYDTLGVYIVTFEPAGNCLANFDTVINLYTVNLELEDVMECQNVPVELNPNGNTGYLYIWSAQPDDPSLVDPAAVNPVVTPQETTTYTAVVQFGTCVGTFETNVQILESPALIAEDTSGICFNGQPLELSALSTETPEWADNVLFNPSLGTGETIMVENPNLGSYYYVRVIGDNGCVSLDSVLALNTIVDIQASNSTVCIGDSAQLQLVNQNPWQVLTYVWNPPVVGDDLIVSPDSNSVYSVTATNAWGCTAEASIQVTQVQVDASIQVSTDAVYAGGEVILNAFPDEFGYSYAWSPEDVVTFPNDQSTPAYPEETTEFTVTVTDQQGCSDTAQVVIRVGDCVGPYIFVPRAFTPNGDGNNDFLRVRTIEGQVEEMYFAVYSRWGQKVYETRDPNHMGWDGKYNGDDMNPDSFGWYLEVRCPGGDLAIIKGNTTLIR